jgi:hypothetical protein
LVVSQLEYALLTLMVAQVCGVKPGELIHTFGDLLAASRGKRRRVSQRMLDGNWLAE